MKRSWPPEFPFLDQVLSNLILSNVLRPSHCSSGLLGSHHWAAVEDLLRQTLARHEDGVLEPTMMFFGQSSIYGDLAGRVEVVRGVWSTFPGQTKNQGFC